MKMFIGIGMLIAIIWLGYSNHRSNMNSVVAAEVAQEHVAFRPFDPAQKRAPVRPIVTAQSDFRSEPVVPDREPGQPATPAPSASEFKCDGRTHCSHMRSCAEATFFIEHCPNTSMDGDNDGIPCEKQWC